MKISGFTIARNAVKFNYPILESIRSVLAVCDEFIINVGDSADKTRGLLATIKDPRIRIIQNTWDLSMGKEVLSYQTNLALQACTGDWAIYLQADEVLHERDLPALRRLLERHLADPSVDSLRFRWLHFYGSYYRYRIDAGWFQKQDRVVRNNGAIESCGDAFGFRRKDGRPLRRVNTGLLLYHYGWVHSEAVMAERRRNAAQIGFAPGAGGGPTGQAAAGDYSYGDLNRFPPYFGPHPAVMREKVSGHALSQQDLQEINRRYRWHPFKLLRARHKTSRRVKTNILLSFLIYLTAGCLLAGQESGPPDSVHPGFSDGEYPAVDYSEIIVPPAIQEKIADMIILTRSKESAAMAQKGMKLIQQGRVREAKQAFWDALAYAPNNSLAYGFLAQIYFWYNEETQALKVLEQGGRFTTFGDLVYFFLPEAVKKFKREEPPAVYPRVSLARFKGNKDCAISFTFDDGPRSVYTLLLPIFDEFGYKATVLINPGVTPDRPVSPYWGSWQEWRDAHRRGFEIGNHSMKHQYLVRVPPEIWRAEIRESYELIQKRIGRAPTSFAFPFDQFRRNILDEVLRNHPAVRERETLSSVYERIFIPVYGGDKFSSDTGRAIIDLAVVKRLWLIPECHAAKTEEVMTFKPITTGFLREHLGYIQEQEDRIWVDTFSNVYGYLALRKDARIQVLEEAAGGVVFSLDAGAGPDMPVVPLTVIVNPAPETPGAATAAEVDGGQGLTVIIKDGLIYLDVKPDGRQVFVSWQ